MSLSLPPKMETNRRISDYILLSLAKQGESGLCYGKIGMIASLLLFAQKTDDDLLLDLSQTFLYNAFEKVDWSCGIGLERGLSGIGCAALLLYKKGLMTGDLAETLADLDKNIIKYSPRGIADKSVRSGLGGVVFYMEKRKETGTLSASFPSSFLEELYSAFTASEVETIRQMTLLQCLRKPAFERADYQGQSTCLSGGSAYYLFAESL